MALSHASQSGERPQTRFWPITWLLIRIAWLLLLFHLLEIAVWALFFWWEKCLPNMSNRLMNEFNALERKAGVLTIQGMQQTTIHTGMLCKPLLRAKLAMTSW